MNAPPSPGLVICATTGRDPGRTSTTEVPDDASSLVDAYTPSFPASHHLDEAARAFNALPPWDGHEGPRARVIVSPGAVAIERRDLARRERAAAREQARRLKMVQEMAAHLLKHGELPAVPESRRVVTRWSRRSRARMTRALCELDYAPLLRPGVIPAMVTLTYPGDWLTVAPRGAAAKKHLWALRRRFRRAWGTDLVCVWKQEFQRRGAPHFHLLMVPPQGVAHDRAGAVGSGLPWRRWLSVVWADIVNHPDPEHYLAHLAAGTATDYNEGLRARDPKRVAVYFTKHGAFAAKEYQNVVPDEWQSPGDGPGRFWGYWGLHRTTRGAELHPEDAIWAVRTMRRWARAQGTTREISAPRTRGGRPLIVDPVRGLAGAQLVESRHTGRRRVRRRANRMHNGAGWLSVNDGPSFAGSLARFLATVRTWIANLSPGGLVYA